MQDETSLPLAPLFWKPGDRLQAGRDKPSPSTPLGETRRQTTCRTGQAFPWHPSRGNQETDYIQDETSLPLAPLSGEPGDRLQAGQDKPSPGTPLRETRGQTTWRTKKPSPGTPLEVTRRQTTCRTKTSLPLAPSRGNQETDYIQDETSLPLAPLSGEPGDRLQAGQDKPSPGTPLRETRGQTTWRTKKPSHGTPLKVTRRQTTYRTKQTFPWHPSLGNQETDYKQDGTSLPLVPLSGKPGDRLHGGQRSLPLAPLSGKPGDRLHAGRKQAFPWPPLGETRRQTTCGTKKHYW